MMGSQIFDQLAEDYDRWFERSPGKDMFQLERWCLERALQGSARPWMEVGVGTGRFAEALEVEYGMDASAPMLEKARARGIEVVQGRAERLPYADASFGAVLMVVTICFLEEPEAALRECFRVLRREGTLVIGMVPADSSWGKDYQRKKEAGHPYYANAQFHTVSQVQQMAKGVGFALGNAFSTLFEAPGAEEIASYSPRDGNVPGAGFVAVRCTKPNAG